MSGPVFISHSSRDKKIAERLCGALEKRGIKCWISSRDIPPGANFQESIVQAVRSTDLMVLVFTANANNSNEIKKELALASQRGLTVIPVRVEDVIPSDAFSYEFATRQWIDVLDDWERAVGRLSEHVKSALGKTLDETEPPPAPVKREGFDLAAAFGHHGYAVVSVVIGVLLGGGVAWYIVTERAAPATTKEVATSHDPAKITTPTPPSVQPPQPTPDQIRAAADLAASQALAAANKEYEQKQYADAARNYLTAARNNNAQAQYQLGNMYEFGQGVAQDYATAASWYKRAADQGQRDAQLQLGSFAQNGFGMARNYAAALYWYQLAAKQGSAAAQNQLGYLYQMGYGVPVNLAEALRWYQAAAEQGSAAAQFRIGHFYEDGLGVPRDPMKARDWMTRAAAAGSTEARTWLASH